MYLLLFLLWVILNGRFDLEIILFGIAISTAVTFFMTKCLEYSPKEEKKLFKNTLRILMYIIVLIVEIIKSSLLVLKFILSKEVDIQPQIVFFKTPLKSEFLKTVLANSITLTPGTITLNVEGDVFCVHALDYTLADGFENSVFVKLLKEIEDRNDV